MARTGVTYLDVAQAAEAIKNRGEEPTVDRVRAELGTGSKSTIAPLLKRWRTETAGDAVDTGGLPKDLVDALKALHERVQQEAEQKVEKAREDFEAATEKQHRELEAARAVSVGLEREQRALQQKLEAAEAENRQLRRTHEESRTALARSEFQLEQGAERIVELKSALAELKQENRDIREHFEHFQQRTADDRQQERDQSMLVARQLEDRIASLSEQLAESGRKQAEMEAIGEQQRANTLELEKAQQRSQQEVSGCRAEIENLEQKCGDLQQQLSAKSAELNTLQLQWTQLSTSKASIDTEVELLRRALAKVESELDTARERVIQLVDENRLILQEKAVIQGQFKQLESSLLASQSE